MTFWLILVLSSATAPQMMHVGNFKSLANCIGAAQEAKFVGAPNVNTPQNTYICIQANEDGLSPPGK
jgi:hypothetical protein